MSTTADPSARIPGIPELTALGRQLEMLRLDRGMSKQALARHAGTSRQQLWRVMTGKSELTASLCQRLAEVLGIDARALRNPDAFARALIDVAERASEAARSDAVQPAGSRAAAARSAHNRLAAIGSDAGTSTGDDPGVVHPLARHRGPWTRRPSPTIAEYLADPQNVVRTLATYPGGEEGRSLKRAFLGELEDCAARAGVKLGPAFFTVRGRVVNGEL